MIVIITLIAIVLLSIYFFLTKNYTYWESKGIASEEPFLIFGNFFDVVRRRKHIFNRICELYNKFDKPYFGIYILNQPLLVVKNPEYLKKLLVKDFDKFADRNVATNESVDPISFHTLFSAKGANWRALRAKISPVFTSGKLKMMYPLMKECAENLHECLEKQNGESVELRDLTKKYAVDLISSCAFGINAYCLKDDTSEMKKVAANLIDFSKPWRSFSIFCFFFAPTLVDLLRLTFVDSESGDYLSKIFKTTLEEREKNNILRNDLIDLLNNMRKQETLTETYKFDDIKMASQAISFFSAGNETTSLTISFAFYELALHKDIQDRLRAEVRETFAKHGKFTYEAIQEMKYLDMVINEVLRMYPLTSFLNREALCDYQFEENGEVIEKGTSIMVPVAGLHFDPKYFPNPNMFDTERFSEENKANITPYTFMPFGEGPRNCIGQRFGLIAVKTAIVHIIKDLALEPCSETQIPMEFYPGAIFLQSEGGVYLKVIKL